MDDLTEIFGTPIDVHTRADAIAAGDLIDAPADLARNVGFAVPVAVTRAAWADCVAWTDADAARTGAIQDEDGRMFDVLWMASRACRRIRVRGDVCFVVWRVVRDAQPGADGDIEAAPVYLTASVDPDGVTIALPGED